MLETLQARKEALEARGKKGFTLMEMLIVIAIIAVLVAIAIPVLGAQLENAREATDAANIRSSYAEVAAAALQNPGADATASVTLTQTDKNKWNNDSVKDTTIGGVKVNEIPISSDTVEIKYTASNNEITIGEKKATIRTLSSGSATPVNNG